MSWYDGCLDTGLRYAAAAADVKCAESHESCALVPFWHVALLTNAREFDSAWRALNSVEAGGGGQQPPRMVAAAHLIRGELLFAMGRVDDGLADVHAGVCIAEQCGYRSSLPYGYVVMALGALRRADMRTCMRFVDKLTGEALLGYFGQAAGAWITAQVAEARSGVDSVAGLIAGMVTNRLVLRQLLVSQPAAASWLVRAAGKLGADDLAAVVVSSVCAASAEQPRFDAIRGSAAHAAGLRERDAGKLRDAASHHPDGWCAASAREDLADLLATRRCERENMIRAFESALSDYAAVGATRDAARVANKLRDFGVRRGAARAVEWSGDLPHGLTDTEFAVAELVSQGRTNSEVGRQVFISRHTVAFHLKKVYQKMGVGSRVELAAIWKAMR